MKPGAAQPELPADAGEATIARLDKLRNASGSLSVAKLRKRLQVAMQQDAAVFRTEVPPRPALGRDAGVYIRAAGLADHAAGRAPLCSAPRCRPPPPAGVRGRIADEACRVADHAGGRAPPRRALRCCCSPCEHC